MDVVPGGSLRKEVRETFVLLGITASLLGGYLGIALLALRAVG